MAVYNWSHPLDLNPKPPLYESGALPLSYFGVGVGNLASYRGNRNCDIKRLAGAFYAFERHWRSGGDVVWITRCGGRSGNVA